MLNGDDGENIMKTAQAPAQLAMGCVSENKHRENFHGISIFLTITGYVFLFLFHSFFLHSFSVGILLSLAIVGIWPFSLIFGRFIVQSEPSHKKRQPLNENAIFCWDFICITTSQWGLVNATELMLQKSYAFFTFLFFWLRHSLSHDHLSSSPVINL